MIYEYKCKCGNRFEATASIDKDVVCHACGEIAERQFHATKDVFIPSYFHTSKSDIYTYEEWQDLKKNPDIERAK